MKPLLAGILTVLAAHSQQAEFDAASIKPAPPAARGGGYNVSPGRLTAKNQSLRDLVKFAYSLQDYQLTGGPPWTDNERYEVTATFPGTSTDTQHRQMMQSLLISRFALQIHRESKETTGYELIPAKKGPKLQSVEPGQHTMMLGRSAVTGQRTLHATSAGMPALAGILAALLRQPVEERTGLIGVFDFDLEWSPDETQPPLNIPGKQASPEPSPETATGLSLFSTLQNTLGLSLKGRKVPVEVIVIDHAEKPTGN
jgi:uncharacterized protein (TIGR03435 family)